jgi:hypothetical protein
MVYISRLCCRRMRGSLGWGVVQVGGRHGKGVDTYGGREGRGGRQRKEQRMVEGPSWLVRAHPRGRASLLVMRMARV